ncbi:uncharacterized protein ACWYII_043062 isoform 4-T5 [Salvelinus alpinus]
MNNCYLGCGRQRGPLFKTEQCSFPSVATASDSLLPMKPGRKPGRKRKQTLCPHSWVQASESVCVAESQPSSRNVVRVRGVGLRRSGGEERCECRRTQSCTNYCLPARHPQPKV